MKKRKFKDSLLYVILMIFIFLFVLPIVLSIPFYYCEGFLMKIPEPYRAINNTYLLIGLPSFISFVLLFCLKDNRKYSFLFNYKNSNIIRGLCLGFLLNIVCVLIAMLIGSLRLAFNDLNFLVLIFAFICVLIPAAVEELLCRGYIQYKLLDKYKEPKIAIFISSIIFSLLHIFNDGITIVALISIFAVGVLLSLITYYTKNLWEAIFLHTMWNFTQNILLGLPNSGLETPYSLFKIVKSSNSIAYNTVFGVESSVVSIIIMVIAIILVQHVFKGKVK